MELTTYEEIRDAYNLLFMMSKIQNLNGTHNYCFDCFLFFLLFMMSKIQNLNGTHNTAFKFALNPLVVYDVKDTKFEWNSQLENKQMLKC